MSYDTLVETLIYSATKSTKAYWKENLYKNLLSSVPLQNIQDLVNKYNDMYATLVKGDSKPTYILGMFSSHVMSSVEEQKTVAAPSRRIIRG